MVEDIKSIRELLCSQKYSELASDVLRRTKKILCDDLYDGELFYCQRALVASGLSLDDVAMLFNQDVDRIRQFCISMIKAEKLIEVGQDFNPQEEPDEEPSNETYVGHSQTFLFTFSIIYILIRDDRIHFAQYLKKMRQPKASKYQKAVESLFDGI